MVDEPMLKSDRGDMSADAKDSSAGNISITVSDGDGSARGRDSVNSSAHRHAGSTASTERLGSLRATRAQRQHTSEGSLGHEHFGQRAPWLRAFVLGANDGLVSVAALMIGVGAGSEERDTLLLSGVSGLVAGAFSMGCGEYVSVASQRDAEMADVEKERVEQAKGPEARMKELDELTQVYADRGVSYDLARAVAEELTEKDVIRAHARDELGIDLDEMANPLQASVVSAIAFSAGAMLPMGASLIPADHTVSLILILIATSIGLAAFGFAGSSLGGASGMKGACRVLVGGYIAMGLSFGAGALFGVSVE